MCGIVGVWQGDGRRVAGETITRMTDALRHRGPDDAGTWTAHAGSIAVGLGHTRLKIVDLSQAANQPMVSDDGAIGVVFNGEIYNFRELRSRLEGQGARFSTSSDTEVLLRLYECDGEACLEALHGMFAFAIWDGRRRCVLLARDRVGKKPLFYTQAAAAWCWASEIKALLRHPDVAAEVNEDVLPSFFLYGYAPTPATLYRGIRSVPPGHWLRIDADGRAHLQQYWDVPLPEPGMRRPTRRAAIARVRELVTEAVRRRLVADVPLGAFLSGGIDSSIVVGLMSRLADEPVRTFSIGFAGDRRYDETSYARLAARAFGTRHTEFMVEPSAVELIHQLVYHHDGAFADSSAIPTYLLSRLTRQHVTVALTGDGGDELFAGYLRFYATVLSERVPQAVREAACRLIGAIPSRGEHRSLLRQAKKFAGSAALPFAERLTRWVSVFYEDLPQLLAPGGRAADSSMINAALTPVRGHMARCRDASALGQLLYLNLKSYLLDDLLVKMDRCAMAHGLEARSPFLDHELIAYAFSLPDALKMRWGRTKAVLRDAFADLLPPAILRRGKMGFGVPLQRWFSHDLREFVGDLLLASDARAARYVNAAYVRRLWEAHASGQADHSHRLWTLLTFEVWLRNLSLSREECDHHRGDRVSNIGDFPGVARSGGPPTARSAAIRLREHRRGCAATGPAESHPSE